jgi:DNA-binding PadR family transcriptional regulator
MKILSRTEEIILAAVWKLQDDAYGISINNYINRKTGLNWKFGSIYTPLGRMVQKGLLITSEGEPSPERGGRRKLYFKLTEDGKEALRNIRRVNKAMWDDLPSLEPG